LLRKTGLSAPIYFAVLRKFRFKPLRGITSGKTGCDEEAPTFAAAPSACRMCQKHNRTLLVRPKIVFCGKSWR
jgi:hypothetical protein